MLVGYARVSTAEQTSALQLDALQAAGCEPIYEDCASGMQTKRPELARMLASLKAGDTLVVWKLDRLGRSMSHLVQLMADLAKREIGFRSLSEAIDTTNAQGRLMLHIMGALAEFERSLIVERTRAGIAAARDRGAHLGRPTALTPAQLAHARQLVEAGQRPPEVAQTLGIGRSTLYRALAGQTAARPRIKRISRI